MVKKLLVGFGVATSIVILFFVLVQFFNRDEKVNKQRAEQAMTHYVFSLYPDANDVTSLCKVENSPYGYIPCSASFRDMHFNLQEISAVCIILYRNKGTHCIPPEEKITT